ncbi:alpha/beta hydrolase [Verrucomicrobia bacterium]|nr:alpha/beta hydrolase [Verrucomicrobiota bacterium]
MAQKTEIKSQTFVYKRVSDLEIKLDVHRANDNLKRKVAVWIHGGALINGGRQGINHRIKEDILDAGYALVSIDYRLAPETKLPQIIEDLEDAFQWIHSEGQAKFNADISRMAVLGSSAGGYLTLTTGFRVHPPPDVLVSFWGYGDLIGPWYSQPSSHARHHRQTLSDAVAEEIKKGAAIARSSDRKGNGGAFYQYCRQRGIWPKEVANIDPHQDPEKFFPYMPLKNVTPLFPPTLLIHGTDDSDVPYEQSSLMAAQFKTHDVSHQFVSVSKGEHGLSGASKTSIEEAYAAVIPFIKKHLDR